MALLEALALSVIAVLLVRDSAEMQASRNECAHLTGSTAMTMAVRRRCHGNDGAIASRASHTRLRCSRVIVAYLCFVRSGGLVGSGSVAVSRPMSMPTMPKQVHCDHADEKYEPDPIASDPIHHSLRR